MYLQKYSVLCNTYLRTYNPYIRTEYSVQRYRTVRYGTVKDNSWYIRTPYIQYILVRSLLQVVAGFPEPQVGGT